MQQLIDSGADVHVQQEQVGAPDTFVLMHAAAINFRFVLLASFLASTMVNYFPLFEFPCD